MTKDEIKRYYKVPEILRKHGIELKHGRCKAVCHSGDNLTAAYRDDLYTCFKCNLSLDVIGLEMLLSSCDFVTACKLISGEELTKADEYKLKVMKAQEMLNKAKKDKEVKQEIATRAELRRANTVIRATEKFTDFDSFAEAYAKALARKQILEHKLGELK